MSKTCPKCHKPFVDGDKIRVIGLSTWHEYDKPSKGSLYAIGRPDTITYVVHLYCPLDDEHGYYSGC